MILILRSSAAASGGGGSAPAWFAAQPDSTWATIASASNKTLSNVLVSPSSNNPPGSWGHASAIIDAYTGGTIDQVSGEYLIVAGGGHGDGANNSGYGLYLRDESPAWRRLTDCTPDAELGDLTLTHDGKFADGRPRAMHASNVCWAGGAGINSRVWFPMMSSVTSGAGGHADWVLSFDRYLLGAADTPLAWIDADIGPWKFWGRTNANENSYGFGGCVFDDVNNQLIAVANASASAGVSMQFIPVTGGSAGVSTAVTVGSPTVIPSWVTIASELGIVIAGDAAGTQIAVMDIASRTWAIPAQTGSGYYTGTAAGCMAGAVYVAANHKIVVADPYNTNGTMYIATIPMSGSNYDPSGTWMWTTISPSDGPNTAAFGSGGNNFACNKWNLIKDMGNGQSAIVFVADIDGPVYVYKVPLAGI